MCLNIYIKKESGPVLFLINETFHWINSIVNLMCWGA